MPYNNLAALLTDATKYPAAIEERLPAGAPKISTMLTDAAGQIPALPDFPVEVPDLPAAPTLPEMPGTTGLGKNRPSVTRATITPVQQEKEIVPSPAAGVLPERIQRRGL